MFREALLKKGVCPRCGKPFRWIYSGAIYGRTYLYAVHEEVEGGKKRRRKCYLGPASSYEYVSKTHDLDFFGLIREDRYIKYLEEILDLFTSEEPIPTDPEGFKRYFENVVKMRSLIGKINNEVEDRIRKIIETIISDVKASIEALKRDHPDDPHAIELVKELKALDEEIERTGLVKSFIFLKDEALRSYVERYLQLKNKMKMFNI
jgi:hypothetical protein